ncbi:hypothetical protein X736_30245 [Mesorhizobium sp. L2C089B000]|nr:hypothetical protein X736_30245 [Mesorhizobium sp. L2C089B000]ESZ51677.1 hypothetical protein X731_03490 [Mesorhizobium sp. L2C054A000]
MAVESASIELQVLTRKAADDLGKYQLWASLALEPLSKAFLAGKQPSLAIDPTHWQSSSSPLLASASGRI